MVGQLTCRRIAPPLTGRSLVWISSSSFTEKEESAFSTAALARACSLPMLGGVLSTASLTRRPGRAARLRERLGEAIPADGVAKPHEGNNLLTRQGSTLHGLLEIIACSVSKHYALHPY